MSKRMMQLSEHVRSIYVDDRISRIEVRTFTPAPTEDDPDPEMTIDLSIESIEGDLLGAHMDPDEAKALANGILDALVLDRP